GPAVECNYSHTGDAIDKAVAEHFVIAWTRRVIDQITVNPRGSSRGCVDDLCANLDLLEVRGHDGAEAAWKASVLQALLRQVNHSAPREGLGESRGGRLADGR